MQRKQPPDGPHPQEAGEPLRMLSALNSRTLRECETMRELAARVAESGCDGQCRRIAESLFGYFDAVPAKCHSIEQECLFPALLESMAGSDPVCLRDLTSALTAQHRALERMWRSLRNPLAALAGGQHVLLDRSQVDAFAALNRSCIERDETELLPMASRLLADDALSELRAIMGEHRLGTG